jgi:hypothetical protein
MIMRLLHRLAYGEWNQRKEDSVVVCAAKQNLQLPSQEAEDFV